MIFSFDDLELDVRLYQLRRGGEVVKLPPKAFDLLLYLIQHRDRVVSKAELLDELWPGEHVTESVLPSNVATIRRALQSEAHAAELIQTVHGRGYRFVATLEERQEECEPARETGLFVGREDLMRELSSDLEEMLSGRGRVLMLAGEPGIGKTRTAEELLDEARRRGALVLVGRCYEGEGVPAFWPWIQILRSMVSILPAPQLREQLGAGAPDLVPLVPEIRQRLSELPDSGALESEQARFRLFDGIASFLHNASRARPLALFLDDLHWADEPSLRLLEFVTREPRDFHLALLGAYRDVELSRAHPLALVLGRLAQEPRFRRIPLRRLREGDIARFMADITGRDVPDALVRAVFEMTEGNPFFICETVRLLASDGSLDGEGSSNPPSAILPQGVREVIGRRLNRLCEECNRVLTLAAVLGRVFSVRVLQETAGISRDALLELLDEAVLAQIVSDQTGEQGHSTRLSLGQYAFCHALIRETLYDELTGPQRVRLHREVSDVLESTYGGAVDAHLPELAHHSFQAAPGGDVARAIDYSRRAAEQALAMLAWEESVLHYERALQLEELTAPRDETQRGELTLGLAQALWRGGSYPQARRTFQQVIQIARRLSNASLLGRAVLGLGGWPEFRADEPPGGPADEYRALLEETLESLADETALRAGVHSQLAQQTSIEARELHSKRAVALARESHDPEALFAALYSRATALLGPDDIRRRLAVSREMLDLALRSGSREKIFIARESRIRSLLTLGDIQETDREIDACVDLTEELRIPAYRHSVSRFRLARALADGRLDEAERLSKLILELGATVDDRTAQFQFDMMTAWLQYHRGDLLPIIELIEDLLDRVFFIGRITPAIAAFIYAELDQQDDARRYFARIAAHGFDDIPKDEAWLMTLALASEACAYLQDAQRAAALYELLLPYAELIVSHQHMRLYLWPVERTLARLAEARGEDDMAVAHYEAALLSCRRIGAQPHLARTQYEYAKMLLTRASRSPERARRADELMARAEATAQELGLRHLLGLTRGPQGGRGGAQ